MPRPLIQLAGLAAGWVRRAVQSIKLAAAEAARQTAEQDVNEQIRQSMKQMRMLAVVAPFAAATGSADSFFIITKAVASFIKLYLLLLFVRVLLSWFPTFQWWEQQPFLALRQVRGFRGPRHAKHHVLRRAMTAPAPACPCAAGHRPIFEALQWLGASAARNDRPHTAARVLCASVPGGGLGCGGR